MRSKISKDRNRFQDFEHDLDLTYVTDKIIAMAIPSSGIETVWRNSIDEVTSLLEHYHKKHYRIWNLAGKSYDYSKFNNEVLDFYFPDHHNPPLELLFRIILSIHSYLQQDPKNVAVIHCVGGKGRTGTVISCYLVYQGLFGDINEALQFFAKKRSITAKGVTQPSQKRYAKYFYDVLGKQVRPHPKTKTLKSIVMKSVPKWEKKGCRPSIEVFAVEKNPGELIYTSSPTAATKTHVVVGDAPRFFPVVAEKVEIELNVPIRADTMIVVSQARDPKLNPLKKKPTPIFRITFHTSFISEKLEAKLDDIDDFKNRKKWKDLFDKDFTLTLNFSTSAKELPAKEKENFSIPTVDLLLKEHKKGLRGSAMYQQQELQSAVPFLKNTTQELVTRDNEKYQTFILDSEAVFNTLFISSKVPVERDGNPQYSTIEREEIEAFKKYFMENTETENSSEQNKPQTLPPTKAPPPEPLKAKKEDIQPPKLYPIRKLSMKNPDQTVSENSDVISELDDVLLDVERALRRPMEIVIEEEEQGKEAEDEDTEPEDPFLSSPEMEEFTNIVSELTQTKSEDKQEALEPTEETKSQEQINLELDITEQMESLILNLDSVDPLRKRAQSSTPIKSKLALKLIQVLEKKKIGSQIEMKPEERSESFDESSVFSEIESKLQTLSMLKAQTSDPVKLNRRKGANFEDSKAIIQSSTEKEEQSLYAVRSEPVTPVSARKNTATKGYQPIPEVDEPPKPKFEMSKSLDLEQKPANPPNALHRNPSRVIIGNRPSVYNLNYKPESQN